jgi:nucleoside-diphosphate-sugar epimerase
VRALVTGATGFVGTELVRTLRSEGWWVRATSREEAHGPWDEHVQLDLEGVGRGHPAAGKDRVRPEEAGQETELQEAVAGVDAVFHLAGRAHAIDELGEDGAAYVSLNVGGTAALVEAAIAAGASRFVFVSSVKATGRGEPGRAIDETVDSPADTAYGRSKRAAEDFVLRRAAQTGVHACVLRPSLVYGPGVKGNLATMLTAVERGRFPPLPDIGNRRSMVDVRDLAAAIVLVAQHPSAQGKTYVVTDGHSYSSRDLHLAMARALGRQLPRWTVPVPVLHAAGLFGDIGSRVLRRRLPVDSQVVSRLTESAWYSSALIEAELGFRPRYRLQDALPGMVTAHRTAGLPAQRAVRAR